MKIEVAIYLLSQLPTLTTNLSSPSSPTFGDTLMNIEREEFSHQHSHLSNKSKTVKAVQDFVNQIGKDRLVNICEYVTNINGDDHTCWIVWYWGE
jgi:hypothetical protein